jgi:hypothetical protein
MTRMVFAHRLHRLTQIFVLFGISGVFGMKTKVSLLFFVVILLHKSGRNDLGEVLISALGPKGRLRSAAEQEIQVYRPGDGKSRERMPTSKMSHETISLCGDYSL